MRPAPIRALTAATVVAIAGSAAALPAAGGQMRVPAASTTSAKAAAVGVRSTRFGRILVDGRGLTLYLFTHDRRNASRCYGACARAWPPLLTTSAPRARTGARRSLLGTTRRRDGTRQVTYRGHPLYHYVGETRAGQVLCQNVTEFGGTWLVVSPRGTAIR